MTDSTTHIYFLLSGPSMYTTNQLHYGVELAYYLL